jgi:hypothetical protein
MDDRNRHANVKGVKRKDRLGSVRPADVAGPTGGTRDTEMPIS